MHLENLGKKLFLRQFIKGNNSNKLGNNLLPLNVSSFTYVKIDECADVTGNILQYFLFLEYIAFLRSR